MKELSFLDLPFFTESCKEQKEMMVSSQSVNPGQGQSEVLQKHFNPGQKHCTSHRLSFGS